MTPKSFVPGIDSPTPPSGDALLFLGRGLDLALLEDRVPTVAEGAWLGDTLHYLGALDGTACFAACLKEDAALEPPWRVVPARSLFEAVDVSTFQVAGRAVAIAEWDRTHRFCGRCAAPTELVQGERLRRCPVCRTPFYPRVAPAVIVLVEREREALLARSARFPGRFFSTLAGFVEPGETLEDTVHREVKEEVGISLRDLRYFGSQPWPFGRSLMVGFTARWASGELRPDPGEIAEARWFSPDAMPPIPPRLSIAHQLISSWLERMKG